MAKCTDGDCDVTPFFSAGLVTLKYCKVHVIVLGLQVNGSVWTRFYLRNSKDIASCSL